MSILELSQFFPSSHLNKDNEDRRIPRPPNAFMLFGQQHRRDIARQFPDLTNKQISKILGNEWRNMRPDDKSFYHRLADEAHADHMKKYPGTSNDNQGF